MKISIICSLIFCLFLCSGCIDVGIEDIGLIDILSVRPGMDSNDVALYMDGNIYVTDFAGSKFTKINEENLHKTSVAWSESGILYTEMVNKNEWLLNLYPTPVYRGQGSLGGNREELLREMDVITLPIYGQELSYVVTPEDSGCMGKINIYEKETSRVSTIFENAYYDYEWLKGERKIVAITVESVSENNFQGSIVIKDIDTFNEDVIFTGIFKMYNDWLDVRDDNTIIFSSENEIYIYSTKTDELSKWEGPKKYDYRLPPSVNSNLKGYILAKRKNDKEGWSKGLYLVTPEKKFLRIPRWPLWTNKKVVICMDTSNCDILIADLDKKEMVNITKKFEQTTVHSRDE